MKVSLKAVADGIELHDDEINCYIDLQSGEVEFITSEEMMMFENDEGERGGAGNDIERNAQIRAYLDNPNNYLQLPSKYDLNEYRIMEDFINTLADEAQRLEMQHCIQGKGAFSRFKRGLDQFDLRGAWFAFKAAKIRSFAEAWCKDNDLALR